MIEEKTVFILGAGASAPYCYPTGKELRDYLCLKFQSYFNNLCKRTLSEFDRSPWQDKVKDFTASFKRSSNKSIDLFLARNDKFSDIGKLAIILSIFYFEHKSKFREEIDEPTQDWYSLLYDRMTKTLVTPDSYKDFGQNDVTFITFNYDRSFEYFLFDSLKHSFSKATDYEIVGELSKVPIYHVYGKVNHLPWDCKSVDRNATAYFTRNDVKP